jgi:hypothetical protein
MTAEPSIVGREHWTHKGPSKLFLWEKAAGASPGPLGTILFVHGSSMASTPTFDLQVPGRTDSSAMDHFARLGYDTWCQKNFRIPYHLLHAFFSQPAPVYRGA